MTGGPTGVASSGVVASHFVLGSELLSYETLETRFGAGAMKKVLQGSGIRDRRVAAEGVCGSDLAFDAAHGLLEHHGIDRGSIDLLIHCTQSPDYLLPTTACLLHERLGLSKRCAAFDLNLGCSQYVVALSVAHSMILAGTATRALVLTGDTMTHAIHPRDRALVPLMGDGASASLVEAVPAGQGFLSFELGTDGSGHGYLGIPAGGFRRPASEATRVEAQDPDGNTRTPQNLYMNGAAIFHFAISVVPPTVTSILAKSGLAVGDVDLFVFHQANKFMLEYLFKKLGIPPEKGHLFLEEIGNTSGSSVPIALTDAWRAGKIAPGMLVLMIGFGVGLSWAATLVRWPERTFGPAPASGS